MVPHWEDILLLHIGFRYHLGSAGVEFWMTHFCVCRGDRVTSGFQLWKHIDKNKVLLFPRADFETVPCFMGNREGTSFSIKTYKRRTKKVVVGEYKYYGIAVFFFSYEFTAVRTTKLHYIGTGH